MQPRPYVSSSSVPTLCLNGRWDFRLHATADAAEARTAEDRTAQAGPDGAAAPWPVLRFDGVESIARVEVNGAEVGVVADFDPASGLGTLAVLAASPVTLDIAELGVTAEVPAGQWTRLEVGQVEPWSAEVPRLYDVEAWTSEEKRTVRVGFRRVEVVKGADPAFLINGRRVKLRGVNRHETNPDLGRVFDEDFLRADLETHGFEEQGWRANPLGRPDVAGRL